MTTIISDKINNFIVTQFPQFMREDQSAMIEFMTLYYEWLELDGNPVGESRRFPADIDIDTAPDMFLEFLRKEFMDSIPTSTLADEKLLMKNIASFFRSKGTEQAYRLLFAILYGQTIEFYYPGRDILRADDGKWVREKYLDVDVSDVTLFDDVGLNVIKGRTSNADARFERLVEFYDTGLLKRHIYVSEDHSTFALGETIYDPVSNNDLAVVLSNGVIVEAGKWINTDGFLDSNKYVEDDFYYQEYSYVIKSGLTINQYEKVAKALVHPAGTKLFGTFESYWSIDSEQGGFDYVITSGYSSSNSYFTSGLDFEPSFDLTPLPDINILANLTGTISTSGNSSILFWGSNTIGNLANVPLGLMGSRDLIRGTSTLFTTELNVSNSILILDTDNGINSVHTIASIFSNIYMQIADVYSADFTNEAYQKVAYTITQVVFDMTIT